ncbi:MAG: hypothetical protein ACRDT2_05765 [Natronosporangium sp.]
MNQRPVEKLAHVEAQPTRLPDDQVRVVVTDASCGLRLLSLTAEEAVHLAGSLDVASAQARDAGTEHEGG